MLGAIADDVTGAVDLATNLVSRGFRTRLHTGVPLSPVHADTADAVVVALKSRTAPVSEALAETRAALDALISAGVDQVYVKYCSTFDSTPDGNIGPVCDLVVERMHAAQTTVVVPSFPDNGRTLYRGHLFVGDALLSESSLAHHPLTPMTDANIVRVLSRQTHADVALIPLEVVRGGSHAVRRALKGLSVDGVRYAVVDAIETHDLEIIAAATADASVVTGGSALALGMKGPSDHAALPAPESTRQGPRIILAGSASTATRAQLARAAEAGMSVFRLDVDKLSQSAETAFAWVQERLTTAPDQIIVIAPKDTGPVEGTTPRASERAAALETTFGALARRFVDMGVRRFIVAGGETSGAVVASLGITDLSLGQTISPGVAWTFSSVAAADGPAQVALALKSGNFGTDDIFLDAWRRLT